MKTGDAAWVLIATALAIIEKTGKGCNRNIIPTGRKKPPMGNWFP